MSKTFGKLFGDAKPSTVATSTSPYKNLPSYAQNAFKQAVTTAQGFTPDMFTTAPITAQQQQATDYFAAPVEGITQDQFNSGLSMFTNPFEEQVLQNAIRDLNTQARGSFGDIGSYASDIGGFGSNRRGLLEAELQKNLLQTVGDVSASSRAANFENAAARTLNELNTVRSMEQQNMGSLFDIGSMFQSQNTQNKNAAVDANSYLAQMAAGVPTASGTLGTYQNPGSIPRISGAIQSTGQLAGQIGGIAEMFSDSRLKENIEHVGNERGFNIYEFNYLEQPTRWRGVMAQEVKEIRPEAVSEIDGFLAVDYSLINMEMTHV